MPKACVPTIWTLWINEQRSARLGVFGSVGKTMCALTRSMDDPVPKEKRLSHPFPSSYQDQT